MGNALGYIAGGLLQGVGEGMVSAGRAKREAALEELRYQRQSQRDQADRDFRSGENQKTRDATSKGAQADRDFRAGENDKNRGLTASEGQANRAHQSGENQANRDFQSGEGQKARDQQITMEEMRQQGLDSQQFNGGDGYIYVRKPGSSQAVQVVDQKGNPVKAPLVSSKKSGSGSSSSGDDAAGSGGDGFELSAAEKRIYDEIKDRYTDERGGQKEVDWQGLVKHLRGMGAQGQSAADKIADALTGGQGNDMTQAEAREKAMADAEERKSMWSGLKAEYPETGGDRQAWIQQRTQQYMSGRLGFDQKPDDSAKTVRPGGLMPRKGEEKTASSMAGKPPGAAAPMVGKGTVDAPFVAKTQADVNWFRDSAPTGSVMTANGINYTK